MTHASGSRGAAPQRFMVLCGPRTGSNMLTSALHSHPEIVCFREVFNFTLPAIDYNVAGFDGRDPAALALRKDEPAVLMERCLFSGHGPSIRAVGFKFIYEQFWDVPGLIEALQAMPGLRVIRRRRTSMPVRGQGAAGSRVQRYVGRPAARIRTRAGNSWTSRHVHSSRASCGRIRGPSVTSSPTSTS